MRRYLVLFSLSLPDVAAPLYNSDDDGDDQVNYYENLRIDDLTTATP